MILLYDSKSGSFLYRAVLEMYFCIERFCIERFLYRAVLESKKPRFLKRNQKVLLNNLDFQKHLLLIKE